MSVTPRQLSHSFSVVECIVEGSLTMLASILAAFCLPDWPSNTKWLTPEQKALAGARIAADRPTSASIDVPLTNIEAIKAGVTDWRVYVFSFMCKALHDLLGGSYSIQCWLLPRRLHPPHPQIWCYTALQVSPISSRRSLRRLVTPVRRQNSWPHLSSSAHAHLSSLSHYQQTISKIGSFTSLCPQHLLVRCTPVVWFLLTRTLVMVSSGMS